MRIESDVLAELKELDVSGNNVRIEKFLDRKLYVRVDKVLQAIGGTWNKKAKAHIFGDDPSERITMAISTASVVVPKDEFDFFPTPALLAIEIAARADIRDGHTLLEPSAGHGALALACLNHTGWIHAIEIQDATYGVLRTALRRSTCLDADDHIVTIQANFLDIQPEALAPFDRVVMNPPFSKLADIAHVRHAHKFLKPGGKLVSVMAPGWTFRQDRRCVEFREFVEEHGHWENLPEESFRESGTRVNTVVLELEG